MLYFPVLTFLEYESYLVNGLLCTLYSPHHDMTVCFFSLIVLQDCCSLLRWFKVTWSDNNGTVIISDSVNAENCDRLSIGERNCGQTDISLCLHAFAHSSDPDSVARDCRQTTAVLPLGLDSWLLNRSLTYWYRTSWHSTRGDILETVLLFKCIFWLLRSIHFNQCDLIAEIWGCWVHS